MSRLTSNLIALLVRSLGKLERCDDFVFVFPACSSSCLTKYLNDCCGANPVVKK